MKIGKASDIFEKEPRLKIAVIGASGSGKTDWAARSPRPLVLLTEPQGMASIHAVNPDAFVVVPETWEGVREIFNAIKQGREVQIDEQPALEVTLGSHTIIMQTLVVDSFTDLQRMMIANIAGEDTGRDRTDFSGKANNLTFEDWGRVISACESIFKMQRRLACNTVFLFIAEERTDEEGKPAMIIPSLSGKQLPFTLGQYFNALGLLRVAKHGTNYQYQIRWRSDSSAITKPAPGWPNTTVNSRTPGETTLGSLLLFSYPGLPVARMEHDSAEFVKPIGPAATTAPTTEDQQPAAQAAKPTTSTRRVARRA